MGRIEKIEGVCFALKSNFLNMAKRNTEQI